MSELFGEISVSDSISHITFSKVGDPRGNSSRSIQSKGEALLFRVSFWFILAWSPLVGDRFLLIVSGVRTTVLEGTSKKLVLLVLSDDVER